MSFIFTDEEYEVAKRSVALAEERFEAERARFAEAGHDEAAQKMLQTTGYTRLQMQKEEIEIYENLRAGNLPESFEITRLPRMLTCMRIASGLSQEQFAERLGRTHKQIQRSEYDEYHGITSLLAQSVIDALPVAVSVLAEDIDTGVEVSSCAFKDLGSMLRSLRESRQVSFGTLASRLAEEHFSVSRKQRQDYMYCALSNLIVESLVRTVMTKETYEFDYVGVTTVYAAIVATALKVKLTVKAKLTK